MSLSLLEILEECRDLEDIKEKAIDLLPDLPFKEQIVNKTFDFEHALFDDLLSSLGTYSYLCLDSSQVVKEIVWRLGDDRVLFEKFFVQSNSHLYSKERRYKLKNDIDKIYYNEIKSVYRSEHYPEELDIRFDIGSYNLEYSK